MKTARSFKATPRLWTGFVSYLLLGWTPILTAGGPDPFSVLPDAFRNPGCATELVDTSAQAVLEHELKATGIKRLAETHHLPQIALEPLHFYWGLGVTETSQASAFSRRIAELVEQRREHTDRVRFLATGGDTNIAQVLGELGQIPGLNEFSDWARLEKFFAHTAVTTRFQAFDSSVDAASAYPDNPEGYFSALDQTNTAWGYLRVPLTNRFIRLGSASLDTLWGALRRFTYVRPFEMPRAADSLSLEFFYFLSGPGWLPTLVLSLSSDEPTP